MKILFATDGSPEADRAKDFVGSLPLAPGSDIIVVSVLARKQPENVEPEARVEGSDERPSEIRTAKDIADRAAYHLARAGVCTASEVISGHPAESVCRVAEERGVDVVVVGSRGRSALARFLLGSVSYRVAKHAASPVLIVKPPAKPIERVLIGVDGSEDSRRAVAFLKRHPISAESSITVAHVIHVPSPAFGTGKGYYETAELGGELGKLRDAAEVEGKRILEEVSGTLRGFHKVDTVVTAGVPAQRLIDLARETTADLLVVGSRGLTGVERFLMGSVSLRVCQHAPCSVLVVRESPQRQRGRLDSPSVVF